MSRYWEEAASQASCPSLDMSNTSRERTMSKASFKTCKALNCRFDRPACFFPLLSDEFMTLTITILRFSWLVRKEEMADSLSASLWCSRFSFSLSEAVPVLGFLNLLVSLAKSRSFVSHASKILLQLSKTQVSDLPALSAVLL
eukprot:767203-Hanusia_phi.AAC.2